MEGRKSGNFINARYRSCCTLLKILVISGFCLINYKAFRLQVVEHSLWVERERAQVETTFEVPAYRGSIHDSKGRLLSYSVPQFSLYADSSQIENPKQLSAQLAPILGLPEETLGKKLSCTRRFVWIKRHLSDQEALSVGNLKARGLNLVTEYKRFYPYRHVAGQVLGFVGMDGTGLEGIEKAFNDVLTQAPVTMGQVRDGVRKCLWLQPSPPPEPTESLGVRLTLDAFIQYVSENELEKSIQQYKAKAGEVVVLDAKTGEILAMANWPLFDPNLPDKKNPDSWRNRAITDYYEPGSTFKVFLVGAALEEGIIRERDRIFCENGKCKLGGHTINDVHPYGWLTIPEVIKHSSNIAASKLALQLGGERYYRYIKLFGFGANTGVNLPGEADGRVRHWKRWRPIDLATTGFGQSIGVTTLQLTRAVGCIANGGEFIQPAIAKELVDERGQAVKQFKTISSHRVLQRKTAVKVSEMMRTVTEEGGTGVNAVPEGYTVAGKTGTAQVLDPVTKRYASNKYTALFTGFVPAEEPKLVITVAIHEPHGAIYGGVVAAPVFKHIAAKALPYLGVLPSMDESKPSVQLRVAGNPKDEPSRSSAPAARKQKAATAQATTARKVVKVTDRQAPSGTQACMPEGSKPNGPTVQAASKPVSRTSTELVLNDKTPKGYKE